ncbi:hypothetical protein [Sphingopyxis sp. R3-92]|uniref:hypothetical protein n=1 Tax=Sphingopyxis sp. R3-92 TaxID=3158553 RepID=UPI003EE73E3E
MVDRPPPSRFSVVERGGRLVVIDRETGQTPPTAAERMAAHDRRTGVESVRPAGAGASAAMSAATRTESAPSARPVPAQQKAAPTTPKARSGKQPWSQPPTDRPALKSDAAPARSPARSAPQTGSARKTIVTGKWWDAKGPRTIELGPQGQAKLSSGFVTLFIALLFAAIVALVVEPILLFVGAFLMFQFGGKILAPIGASLVDKALAEKG